MTHFFKDGYTEKNNMYELIILSILMNTPAHGYLIAKIINSKIGPYAKISNGRLYPLLSKLEESGLITIDSTSPDDTHSDHHTRSYRITEIGKKRFHQLMMDTTSNPGDYQRIFMQKASVLRHLQSAERLYLIDHYINYCQAHVLYLTAKAEGLAHKINYGMSAEQVTATLDVMRHLMSQWQLELQWANGLRQQESQ